MMVQVKTLGISFLNSEFISNLIKVFTSQWKSESRNRGYDT